MSREMKIKQSIQPGSILHKEKPFVYVLSSKLRTTHCDYCFKRTKLLKCSSCLYVYYCGKVCQKDAWTVHKLECKNLKSISPRILPDIARLIARLIRTMQRGGDQVKSYYLQNSFRMYKDLMSHYPNIKADQKRMEHFTSICGVLFDFLGGDSLPNSAELIGMYGRICINSFNVMSQDLECLGTAVYLGASVIDHSCKPNAVATFEGTTLYVRALESFQYLDWSQIRISYIDTLNTTKDRQEELESHYYFFCQCPRCLEPECGEINAAACPNRNCDNFIDVKNIGVNGKCSKCDTIVTEEFLSEFNEVMEFTDMQLENMNQSAYLDVCKVCLQKQEGILYKFNMKHIKILDLAFQSSIDFENWDEAKIFGLRLIEAYSKYYGKTDALSGLLHLKLGKILVFLNEMQLALVHLKESFNILSITHGRNSSLFKEELLPLLKQATNL